MIISLCVTSSCLGHSCLVLFSIVTTTKMKLGCSFRVAVRALTKQLQRFNTIAIVGTYVGCQLREKQKSAEPVC